MNHSIITANRNAQLKIVAVGLLAAIVVAVVGITARLNSGTELAGVNLNQPAQMGTVKAQRPVVWTENGKATVR